MGNERDLEQALLRWEMGGQEDFAVFAEKAERYANFQWRHMQQEEELVLPLAERVLTEEDWREIDAAFAGNADPLIAKDVEKDFEQITYHPHSGWYEEAPLEGGAVGLPY